MIKLRDSSRKEIVFFNVIIQMLLHNENKRSVNIVLNMGSNDISYEFPITLLIFYVLVTVDM